MKGSYEAGNLKSNFKTLDKICRCLKAFDIKEKCWLLENRKEMLVRTISLY